MTFREFVRNLYTADRPTKARAVVLLFCTLIIICMVCSCGIGTLVSLFTPDNSGKPKPVLSPLPAVTASYPVEASFAWVIQGETDCHNLTTLYQGHDGLRNHYIEIGETAKANYEAAKVSMIHDQQAELGCLL